MATQYFSQGYQEAREKFLAAASASGGSLEAFHNPNASGPDGEGLFTDVAFFENPGASKALFVVSGTHGNEGFCGSGCQVGYLSDGWHERRASDTSVILVHAINPYGFANVRRVTEDNVDLNRNFVDHSKPYNDNPAYEAIHNFAVPESWDEDGLRVANAGLAAYAEEHGAMALQAAISGGQHTHPDGVFFAGTKPTWSNNTLRAIVGKYLKDMDHVGLIDFHTGLGPRGYGELILFGDSEGSYNRAQSWYEDEVTSFDDGSSTSAKLTGIMSSAFLDILGPEKLTGIAVEYGTYDMKTVLTAMRFDNWINLYENPGTSLWMEGKKAIRDALYCDDDEWKKMIWERAQWVFEHAYAGLKTA
jgi:hypothetical protein